MNIFFHLYTWRPGVHSFAHVHEGPPCSVFYHGHLSQHWVGGKERKKISGSELPLSDPSIPNSSSWQAGPQALQFCPTLWCALKYHCYSKWIFCSCHRVSHLVWFPKLEDTVAYSLGAEQGLGAQGIRGGEDPWIYKTMSRKRGKPHFISMLHSKGFGKGMIWGRNDRWHTSPIRTVLHGWGLVWKFTYIVIFFRVTDLFIHNRVPSFPQPMEPYISFPFPWSCGRDVLVNKVVR